MDYTNTPDASSRGTSKSHNDITAAVTGLKVYKVVAVSFGLLCFIQAVLNIWLRLSVNNPVATRSMCKNPSEDQNALKPKLPNFDRYFQEGWVYFNTSLYYISSTKATWLNSRQDCLQRGADLVIINSREEQNFARKIQTRMWIGLIARDESWIWVDGSPLTTSFWSPNEPNGCQYGEHCAEIKFFQIEDSWNDTPCGTEDFWVCEKMVTV